MLANLTVVLFLVSHLVTSAFHCKYYSVFEKPESTPPPSVITLKDITGKVFTLPALLCSAPKSKKGQDTGEGLPTPLEFCFFCYVNSNLEFSDDAEPETFIAIRYAQILPTEPRQIYLKNTYSKYLPVRGPPHHISIT